MPQNFKDLWDKFTGKRRQQQVDAIASIAVQLPEQPYVLYPHSHSIDYEDWVDYISLYQNPDKTWCVDIDYENKCADFCDVPSLTEALLMGIEDQRSSTHRSNRYTIEVQHWEESAPKHRSNLYPEE